MLHKVLDKSTSCCPCLTRTTCLGRSQLVEKEVHRCEAEDKRLVFVFNKIGA